MEPEKFGSPGSETFYLINVSQSQVQVYWLQQCRQPDGGRTNTNGSILLGPVPDFKAEEMLETRARLSVNAEKK